MAQPVDILRQYWGYSSFRPRQEEIIHSVLNGTDTLALLPTGGGKSICFQVPGLLLEGVCIVITPLIALMKDQVQQLTKRGIRAQAIFSGLHKMEIDRILDNCIYGNTKFLYISPERLKTDIFKERVAKMNVGLLAVDEAHCISQWGYDFRPAYLQIADIKSLIPNARLMAVTATATKQVKEDIVSSLEMANPAIFQKSFARENLSYSVFKEENKEKKMLKILSNVSGSAIVYVRSRRRTQEIAHYLYSQGISADFYHAGLKNEDRNTKQEKWINNQIRVMVSTNAFGMGIDKPDVRSVIHMDIPESLEAYYQEAGRAGRDERSAYGVLLYGPDELNELKKRVSDCIPSAQEIRQVYQSLSNYLKLAIGSGLHQSFDFDLSEFVRQAGMHPTKVIKCLEQLEVFGLIQLSDALFEPAKLNIRVSYEELYAFQIEQAQYDPLIKALLRLYGGELYQNFVRLQISNVSKMAKMTNQQVLAYLKHLNDKGLLHFVPQKEHGSITFLTERLPAEAIPIDTDLLKFRRESALKRLKGITQYASTKTQCRTRILQAYFDELTNKDCGVCDYCLNKKKLEGIPVELILENLDNEGWKSVQEIKMNIKGWNEKSILEGIRYLIEEGRILQSEKGYKLN